MVWHPSHPRLVALLVASSLWLGSCGTDTDKDEADPPSASEDDGQTAPADADSAAEPDANNGSGADPCLDPGTAGATATCLSPTKSAAYYAEQANKYFDTLDTAADPDSVPNYSELVARWEWPPWLLLTGYGKTDMIETAKALKVLDPSTVPSRDCRGFDVQPFARCLVVFEYEGGPCPIYEEFTFNDAGEVTFIEAWSDLPGLRPQAVADDPWGERGSVQRLSTRVPGLGNPEGKIDLQSQWMIDAAAKNPHVAELAKRAADWWTFWLEEVNAAPPDFFAKGCGW